MRNRYRYPESWHDTIRPRALIRAGYKCEVCRVAHRAVGYYDPDKNFVECDAFMLTWAKSTGRAIKKIFLQVAHLDHNPANNAESNLKVFCPRCHLRNDNSNNVIKRLSKK